MPTTEATAHPSSHYKFAATLMLVLMGPAAALDDPTALYGVPNVERTNRDVTIGVATPPAGASWREDLDPNLTYRVRISGSRLDGPFSLRTTSFASRSGVTLVASRGVRFRRSG